MILKQNKLFTKVICYIQRKVTTIKGISRIRLDYIAKLEMKSAVLADDGGNRTNANTNTNNEFHIFAMSTH